MQIKVLLAQKPWVCKYTLRRPYLLTVWVILCVGREPWKTPEHPQSRDRGFQGDSLEPLRFPWRLGEVHTLFPSGMAPGQDKWFPKWGANPTIDPVGRAELGPARANPQVPPEPCTRWGSKGKVEQVTKIWRICSKRRQVQLQAGRCKPCLPSGFAELPVQRSSLGSRGAGGWPGFALGYELFVLCLQPLAQCLQWIVIASFRVVGYLTDFNILQKYSRKAGEPKAAVI